MSQPFFILSQDGNHIKYLQKALQWNADDWRNVLVNYESR